VAGKAVREIGFCISDINEGLIKSCGLVIANITPFRGPSADVGTVYEIGFAHGLGKKVLAYTNSVNGFTERTVEALKGNVIRDADGKLRDEHGMFIEENELTDNLMIDGCIHANTRLLVQEAAPVGQLFTYLGAFEKCLKAAKELLKK
jgi:nucleoside 2-deoxyribosyltransferase